MVPPDEYFEGFVDSDGWYLVHTMSKSQKQDNFEYHPIKQVNDVLESISLTN